MSKLLKVSTFYAVIIMMLLSLSACGTNDTTSSQKLEEGEPEKMAKNKEEDSSKTRQYTDVLGREVVIPDQPQRVVALWSVGELLALNTKPVGSTKNLLRFYSEEEQKDIEIVGEGVMGDYEKVLSLQPDLILVYAKATAEELEQYSKIAPTVATAFFGDPFQTLRDVGEIMNKQEQAEQWITAYQERVEKMRVKAANLKEQGEKALVIQFALKDIYLYHSDTFPTIFDAYEFELTDKQKELQKDEAFAPQVVSLELLPEFNADRIFLIVNDDESRAILENIQSSRIWKDLPAVKNNKVYEIQNRISTKDVTTLDWALDEVFHLLEQ